MVNVKKRTRVGKVVRIETPAVRRILRIVAAANRLWQVHCNEFSRSMNAPDARERWEAGDFALHDGFGISQEGYSLICRFQAAYSAWNRGMAWATEDRLHADAMLFVDYVQAECREYAKVIRMKAVQ